MKIAILTKDDNLYSCKRLYEAGKMRGHIVHTINPLLCHIITKDNSQELFYKDKKINHFDAVISRINPNNFYNISIMRYFEILGTYCLNCSESMITAKNKFLSIQLLEKNTIRTPKTIFFNYFNNIDNLIKEINIPLIIKLIHGTQGIGVILANTKKSAVSIIDSFHSLNINIILQEYIKESKGSDIRCLVIDGKVVGAIERKAQKKDFRSNLHRGGKAKIVKINEEEEYIAIKAAKILNLNLAGVDILRSFRGPLVIEVNASPGIEGIENTLKIDIASLIIKMIEKKQNQLSKFLVCPI